MKNTQLVTELVTQVVPVAALTSVNKIMLTVAEAAQAISISEVHMWRLVGRKVIPSVKIGKSRRILVSALEAYAQSLVEDNGDAA